MGIIFIIGMMEFKEYGNKQADNQGVELLGSNLYGLLPKAILTFVGHQAN
jgi:hypothetical protein